MGNVKKSAIPYAGYDYQTLHAVRILLDWTNNPNLYAQVAIEADTTEEDVPTAIEDIVCKRQDGTYEYYQVKFTVDETMYELSWDWLFHKTKKGRSLIRKLFDGLAELDPQKIFSAQLLTNRVPDTELNSCIHKNQIIYSQLSDDIKSKLIIELETEENVKFLLDTICFHHSQKDISKLRIEVISKDFKTRSMNSIYRLLDEAKSWATHKNTPNDGGWILLADINRILSDVRPKPLPQSFVVPNGYIPPCESFHNNLIQKIESIQENIFVLTGPPGRGKSTYLSYLSSELDKLSIPYVRHHYFVSIGDRTGDRFSHWAVQQDLRQQLEMFHGASREKDLIKQITECAIKYASQSKPLVIVIDGLDHVWRSNYKDSKPLDSLFNELLPPIENVIYIIGTQPVDDDKLPSKLLMLKNRDEWLTLPAMTGNSILSYLKNQVNEKRLYLSCHEDRKEEELSESAKAILEITLGHPLSVIYVTEYLSINKVPVRAYAIEQLPKVYGDDINHYYSELWKSISYQQKYILHTLCEFNFSWSKTKLNELFSNGIEEDHVSGIQHLLYQTRTGYKPFHESLIVYVQDLANHNEIIHQNLEKITEWIEHDAPEYISNIFKFHCYLKTGNLKKVSDVLTRSWVVERLAEGYLPDELEKVLDNASLSFIENGHMVEPHRFRTIKTRISNIEHNVDELEKLVELTLRRAPISVIDSYLESVEYLSTSDIAILSICLFYRGSSIDADDLNHVAKNRYNANNRLRPRQNSTDGDIPLIFRSSVLLERDLTENIKKFGELFYSEIMNACIESRNLDAIIKYQKIFESTGSKQLAEINAFRLSIAEGVNLKTVISEPFFTNSALLKFARIIDSPISGSHHCIYLSDERTVIDTNSASYEEEFFSTLTILADVSGDFSWLSCDSNLSSDSYSEKSPTKIYDAILVAALDIIERLKNGDPVTFSLILSSIYECDLEHEGHREQSEVNNFKHEFVMASLDCHLLFNRRLLDTEDVKYLVESDFYNSVRFFHWYAESSLILLTQDALDVLLNDIDQEIPRLDIQERTNLFIARSQVLLNYSRELEADEYIRKSWDLAIGYASYKDPTINDLINSMEYLFEVNKKAAIDVLKEISPFIASFDGLTTEGSNPNNDINELLAKGSLNTLVSKYQSELSLGEAYLANATLNSLLEHADLSHPLLEYLCRTGLLHENLFSLEARADKGNARAKELLRVALEHNGSSSVRENEEKYTNSNIERTVLTEQNFSKFPPDKFQEFITSFKDKYLYEEHYVAWFDYWCSQGRQRELLKILTPIALAGQAYELRYLLDGLFELSLKYQGKNKAFKLIVAAHNQNEGWSNFYDRKKTYKRLDKVAEIYSGRADEFVKNTTYINPEQNLKLPYHKYTYLLAKLNRADEVESFVKSLVNQLIDETKMLLPDVPEWNWASQSNEEVILDLLIARLMVPIAAIKWWVARVLVELLLLDEYALTLESKLLAKLNECHLELESIELLTIFYFASLKGYKPNKDIAKSVSAKSICSDLIIEQLGLSSSEGFYSINPGEFRPCFDESFRQSFSRSNGRSFPLIYFNTLNELQEESRLPLPIPLTEIMISEWCSIQNRASDVDSGIRYYINSAGYSKGLTALGYPSSGLVARSSYLRALEFARINYGMPKDLQEVKASLAYPFDSCLFNLEPKNIDWFQGCEWSTSRTSLVATLSELVNRIESESLSHCLGALSFGVEIDSNSIIEVDMTRIIGDLDSEHAKEEQPWVWRLQNSAFDNEKLLVSSGDDTSNIKYLASKSYPFEHYGHWHSEVDSRGVFSPVCYESNFKISMEPSEGKLIYKHDEIVLAEFIYGNNNWQPSYEVNAQPNTVTNLMLNKSNVRLWAGHKGEEALLCKVRVLSRKESYLDFTVEDLNLMIKPNPK